MLVTLTAANIGQIASRHFSGAFVLGTAISWLWFGNARNAAHGNTAGLREAYALGAGLGTLFGIWLVWAIYG